MVHRPVPPRPAPARRLGAVALLVAAALGAGCAHTPPAAPNYNNTKIDHVQMEPMAITAVGQGQERRLEAYDAGELFQQASADLQAEQWDKARAGYDRVIKEFPDSKYVVASLYNAGLAAESLKDFAGAASRYRQLVDRHGETKDALDALFRMGACLAELENWPASAEAFSQLLAHQEISTFDRLEALARRGLAQYNMKDRPAAERTFREALSLYRERQEIDRLEADFFVAMSQYYIGELAHDDFRAAPVRLPERQMRKDLEEKARLLLVAQARYVDVARIRHVGWATAAGYQMARLYREFYDAILAAPAPTMTDEERQVYFEELKKFIEPLLLKAIHAHELTQGVAQRNGVDNEWTRKSSEELEQLRALVMPATSAPGGPPPPPLKGRPTRPELEKMAPPSVPPHEQGSRRGIL